MIYELDKNEKAAAINLAMNIDLGLVSLDVVLDEMKKDKMGWSPIIKFWIHNSDLTRSVIERLLAKRCFDLPAKEGVL